jgi:hypothetical protein
MNKRDMRSYVGTLAMPATNEAWAVHHEVVEADCYRFRELHESGFRPRMIWDLGASWGVASAVMAHWWPDATIWAFEPQPERSRFAVANCRAFPNVRVFETGLVGYLRRDAAAALAGIAFDPSGPARSCLNGGRHVSAVVTGIPPKRHPPWLLCFVRLSPSARERLPQAGPFLCHRFVPTAGGKPRGLKRSRAESESRTDSDE